MVKAETVRELAMAFEEATESLHFEKPSFRVRKKIFATIDLKLNRICIKLSAIDQSVFSAFDPSMIYPVPNSWGKQGWTFLELKTIKKAMLKDALTQAYCAVAPKTLAAKYRQE